MAMFGNTNQPIDVMVQTGHLFEPMPDVIRDDMAFIDRLHFYLPGWEIPKMRNDLFTDHYGFVVDYLAEALARTAQAQFHRGHRSPLRDRGRISMPATARRSRKTVSGLMKIYLSARQATKDELAETPRVGDGRPAAGEGAAQEDGLLRVLPDVLQLHATSKPARSGSSASPSRAAGT